MNATSVRFWSMLYWLQTSCKSILDGRQPTGLTFAKLTGACL